MRIHPGRVLAVTAILGMTAGTAAQAAEIGLLEMLFGGRQSAPPAQQAANPDVASQGPRKAFRVARRRPSIRYAALPVKIRVRERDIVAKERDVSERQQSIDMSGGAAAAFLKDETLRPGDIVVLKTGARVFAGSPDKRHAMRDFVPIQSASFMSRSARKQVAGLFTPVSASPADEARRVVARTSRPAPEAISTPVRTTAMRVINPWRTGE